KKCFDISPSSFTPPPKVISSVLQLTRRQDAISSTIYHSVQKLVRQSFQYRRKTLRNNLKSYIQNQELLQDSFFDRRPEELAPEEYIRLLKNLNL
ncbi:MAG: 16S rRNA (adenine(1518)-N(6)/adenine(1519)-N(6))-dimethyltransferase, partial [Saprospiraceae bacterium]|nr:16S rRNA (adenine(1518)-N(6)/adenine(1519)-N(6))-dimethyltransferase [Saprospiraceae bacterium]